MDPVIHFELPFDDAERVSRFYSAAFGWSTRALGAEMGNYVLATTSAQAQPTAQGQGRPGAIDGGFFQRRPDSPEQHPSVVIGVRDLADSMAKVERYGGKVLGAPMEIPGVGSYVPFQDTEGTRVGMLQPLAGA